MSFAQNKKDAHYCNLPSRHPPDCLCERCWQEKVGGRSYSAEVLSTLAGQAIVIGIDFTAYYLSLVNEKLASPLSELELKEIVIEVSQRSSRVLHLPGVKCKPESKSAKPRHTRGIEL